MICQSARYLNGIGKGKLYIYIIHEHGQISCGRREAAIIKVPSLTARPLKGIKAGPLLEKRLFVETKKQLKQL